MTRQGSHFRYHDGPIYEMDSDADTLGLGSCHRFKDEGMMAPTEHH